MLIILKITASSSYSFTASYQHYQQYIIVTIYFSSLNIYEGHREHISVKDLAKTF